MEGVTWCRGGLKGHEGERGSLAQFVTMNDIKTSRLLTFDAFLSSGGPSRALLTM